MVVYKYLRQWLCALRALGECSHVWKVMAVELMGVLIAFQLRSQQPHKLDVLAALFIIQEACIVRLEKFEQHIRPAWFNLSQLQTSGRKLTGDLGFSLYACHIIWETLLNIALIGLLLPLLLVMWFQCRELALNDWRTALNNRIVTWWRDDF